MALIEFKNFSFSYLNSDGTESLEKSLDNISLNINFGDFVLLCGPSGCGKTTLLTNLKKELMPNGRREGSIKYNGTEIAQLDDFTSACDIGYLFQNPDSQIVTDTVIQEIAFPLENIGLPTEEIRNRISEIVAFFGINDILHKNVNELSGGQKQLINLCSLLVLRPKVLLLDEPMSQLDPIASYEFLSIIRRLNEEFSITVIMSEHKADSIFPFIDNAVFLKDGKIEFNDNAHDICEEVINDDIFENYLPAVTKIYNGLSQNYLENEEYISEYEEFTKLNTPLSIREGRRYLNIISDELIKINEDVQKNNNFENDYAYDSLEKDNSNQNSTSSKKEHDYYQKSSLTTKKYNSNKLGLRDRLPFSNDKNTLIRMNGIYFAYEKNNLILKNVDFKLNKGDFLSLVGGNGVGKSTFLQILVGILKPIKGKVRYSKNLKIAYVHQNPMIHFSKDTVKEEFLESILSSNAFSASEFNMETYDGLLKLNGNEFLESDLLNNLKFKNIDYRFKELIGFFDIENLLDKHPYDCSGGEQEKIVIVKALIQNTDVLVLDEPTKGLDPISSKNLAYILNSLVDNGLTIVMTSHDLDFVANNCKRCLMLFDKDIQIDDDPKVIFAENNFYTTFVNRMVKDYIPQAVTLDDVKEIWDLK
ncbi:cobalt ABC transporter ATP-binding protein CbiO3 [Methanobrevibacter ruminantium M1]|uniref:Cobalt ABC transporter ATP-binding protein CbiO3 n=1 Tax=Methanobrevibacter ruminantium (strain ATCC 35063 / DSM 1093 / JCM 13430 / OCM 146 / M1) TaxID=634498 RepID=D3E3F9_METRM|nr:ATP-binding cassette domain-containing protein [Methanobrevibacter ruminantium]ADC47070.1 cobalt ABC transporter ATP-binding protein CbiO3 [Methanobrevibacter ruminantium M1]